MANVLFHTKTVRSLTATGPCEHIFSLEDITGHFAKLFLLSYFDSFMSLNQSGDSPLTSRQSHPHN